LWFLLEFRDLGEYRAFVQAQKQTMMAVVAARPDRAVDCLSGKSIYTTSSCPYRGTDGSCQSGTASGVTVNGYSRVSKSDSALASALGSSAIAVMVDAVLATGNGSNFFKIKNSWSTS